MKDIIKKIQNNPVQNIFTVIFLYFFVLKASGFLSRLTTPFLGKYFDMSFYTGNVVLKIYMLMMSIGLILILNNGTLKNYGFNKPKNIKYLKMILVTAVVTYASIFIGSVVFQGILSNIFPSENTKTFPNPKSIIEMVLTVWIWSSICEEIFVRGLLQGFMQNLNDRKIWKFSLPVVVSGLLFGLMHLGLLGAGMEKWFVGMIVFQAIVLGFLTAYYREKTESIIPAILIHFLANLFGSLPLVIMMIFDLPIPK